METQSSTEMAEEESFQVCDFIKSLLLSEDLDNLIIVNEIIETIKENNDEVNLKCILNFLNSDIYGRDCFKIAVEWEKVKKSLNTYFEK